MDTEENKDTAQSANHKDSNSDTKLEGALGPLVQQIKLLQESFDDKYSHLDEKYTRLEAVITSQKEEGATKIGKLQESITSQKRELSNAVEQKIEHTNQQLEQVLKENTSLKKANVQLQDHSQELKVHS